LTRKADVFIVGFIANTSQLGIYNVASELSRMATAEVVIPMSRAIFPNFAKLKDDLKELSAAFLLVTRTTCIISFSFGFGIAAVANDLVHVILGDQWGFAASLIAWLGIGGAFASIISTLSGHILVIRGRERMMFFINWVKLAALGGALLVASRSGDIVVIAMVGTVTLGIVTLACVLYLPKILPISASKILQEILWSFVIGLIMFVTVRALHLEQVKWHAVRLLIDAAVGATVFVTLLGIQWNFSGRPDGPEKRLLSLIGLYFRKLALKG
jgi:O-antigen/teichoic acid export membrane protein